MKSFFLNIITVAVVGLLTLTSCNSKKAHEGKYAGTMPCADCEGIYTEIQLDGNNYTIKQVYKGKGDEAQNTFTEKGTYTWDQNKHIVTLNGDEAWSYRVGDGTLIALDMYGNEVTGDLADMYILRKK